MKEVKLALKNKRNRMQNSKFIVKSKIEERILCQRRNESSNDMTREKQ